MKAKLVKAYFTCFVRFRVSWFKYIQFMVKLHIRVCQALDVYDLKAHTALNPKPCQTFLPGCKNKPPKELRGPVDLRRANRVLGSVLLRL